MALHRKMVTEETFMAALARAETSALLPVLALLFAVPLSMLFGPLVVLLAAPLVVFLVDVIESQAVRRALGRPASPPDAPAPTSRRPRPSVEPAATRIWRRNRHCATIETRQHSAWMDVFKRGPMS